MTHRTDPLAINFVQAMRRRAIARARTKYPPMHPACVLEVTDQGNLTCHAAPGPVTEDGEQLYRTTFELNGSPISRVDAEAIMSGQEAT